MNRPSDGDDLGDDIAAIGSWGDPGRVPPLDQLTVRASAVPDAASGGGFRRPRVAILAAAAVAAVIAGVAGILAVDAPRDDVDVVGPPDDTSDQPLDGPIDNDSAATCEEVDRFAQRMSNLGITYDYQPSASLAELASVVDVVVEGTIVSIREHVDGDDHRVVFGVEATASSADVIEADESFEMWLDFGPASVPYDDIAAAFTAGIPTVLFLDPGPAPGTWAPTLEGLWVACDRTGPAASALVEPAFWSHSGSLDDLFSAARSGPSEPAIEVDVANEPRAATIAFGRLWIGATDGEVPLASTLEAFEIATAAPVGPVVADGPRSPDLAGDVLAIAATEHYLWVRTSSGGPAYEEYDGADNLVYRVDPTTLAATATAFLTGDGPLAARADRVFAADHSGLRIFDENGSEIANVSLDEATGVEDSTTPGTNGIVALRTSDDGLWARHQGREWVLQLDPDTGRAISSVSLAEASGAATPAEDVWWISASLDRPLVLRGVVLSPGPMRVVLPDVTTEGRNALETIDRRSVFVDRPFAVFDPVDGSETPLGTGEGTTVSVVRTGEGPWTIAWRASDDVHLVRAAPLTAS